MGTLRLKLHVHGRVQGVFFRQSTVQVAEELGLVGWVRNTPDGTVEICAEGADEQVHALLCWCRSGGPPAAWVKCVEQHEAPSTGEFHDFRIVR